MAIAPDDSDSRLRSRISLSPSYAATQEAAANAAVAEANALVARALATGSPTNFTYGAGSAPTYTAPTNFTYGAGNVPTYQPATKDTTIPAINNRSNPPGPARQGYKWQWFSMAKVNNPYGGEWREVSTGTPQNEPPAGGGNNTNLNTNIPAAPTGPTLAIDTFKNTLALFFGQSEMNNPWVDGLYKSISTFYRTGSSVEESFNLALQASRTDPNMKPFTDRFKGIYALQDMRAKGGAIEVPTIAEFIATEAKMGDILRATGLGTLANEPYLGDVIGKGVSATEFANRITAVFDRIDQAPQEIKTTLNRFFPTIDRVQLAKAILGGEKTAKELENTVQGYEVLAAAETQGIGANTLTGGVTEGMAANLAAGGATYGSTITGFGQVAQARQTEQKLAEISGKQSMGVAGLTSAVLGKKAKELTALEELTKEEEARYKARSGVGTLASSKRAQSF
jgi:hypothetical protein